MKKYFIKSEHEVNIDTYKDGELENVNYYSLNSFITAENARQAIEHYFENVLYYDFDFKYSIFKDGVLFYSVLVDVDNQQATKNQIKVWKTGKNTLYSNNISVRISECTEVLNLD